jgi:methyltransferase family protein
MTNNARQADPAPDQLTQLLHAGDVASWTLAAIAVALSGTDGAKHAAALAVLQAAGVDPTALDESGRERRAAQAVAPLLQAGAVAGAREVAWADQSDQALLAQGRASAQGGPAFARMVPTLPGLAKLLAEPGAAILDVGTGTGALAVAYAEALPGVRVIGIDVLPRAIALATSTVASSGVADHVEIRLQDVQDLRDTERYAMAWLPAPFIPETALRNGIGKVTESLKPGGWIALGYGRLTGTPIEQTITRFKIVSYGGTALDDIQAHELLNTAGLVDITSPPLPKDAPAITFGRRPPG